MAWIERAADRAAAMLAHEDAADWYRRGLRRAMDRLALLHPTLASHLEATIHRGYFCSYTPDPRLPVVWDE